MYIFIDIPKSLIYLYTTRYINTYFIDIDIDIIFLITGLIIIFSYWIETFILFIYNFYILYTVLCFIYNFIYKLIFIQVFHLPFYETYYLNSYMYAWLYNIYLFMQSQWPLIFWCLRCKCYLQISKVSRLGLGENT